MCIQESGQGRRRQGEVKRRLPGSLLEDRERALRANRRGSRELMERLQLDGEEVAEEGEEVGEVLEVTMMRTKAGPKLAAEGGFDLVSRL